MSAASASSASGSQGQVVGMEPTESPSIRGDETCSTTSEVPLGYPPYCRRKRSCRSCLQKSGCMIDQTGACVNQVASGYSTWMDFQNAFENDLVLGNASRAESNSTIPSQYWTFPSFEVKYCPTSDPVCSKCIENDFWWSTRQPDSRFCVGTGGCVCVMNCEVTYNQKDFECDYPTSSPTPSLEYIENMESLDSMVKIMALGMVILLLLFAACLFRCVRKDYDRRRQIETERRLAREARAALREQQRRERLEKLGVSALTLSGWQTFRQSLIDKENSRAARVADAESANPYVLAVDDVDDDDDRRPGRDVGLSRETEPRYHSSVQ